MSLGELVLKLKIDDRAYVQGMRGAKDEAQKTGRDAGQQFSDSFGRSLQNNQGFLQNTLNNIFTGIGISIGMNLANSAARTFQDTFSKVLDVGVFFESTEASFLTALQGDAEKTKKLLQEVQDFAAKTTFSLRDVAGGSTTLLLANEDPDQLIDTLARLGNIAAGAQRPLQQLLNVYRDVKVAGEAVGGDKLQLKPFFPADLLRTAEGEDGKLQFEELQQVIQDLTSEGGRFFGLMDAQAEKVGGKISNLGDNFDKIYLGIYRDLEPAISAVLQLMLDVTNTLSPEGFDKGLFAGLATESKEFADSLKDNPEIVQALTEALQNGLNQVLEVTGDLLQQAVAFLQQNPTALADAVDAGVAVFRLFFDVLTLVVSVLKELAPIFQNVTGILADNMEVTKALLAVWAGYTIITKAVAVFGTLTAALTATTGATTALTAVASIAVGPAGWIALTIAAVYKLTEAYKLLTAGVKEYEAIEASRAQRQAAYRDGTSPIGGVINGTSTDLSDVRVKINRDNLGQGLSSQGRRPSTQPIEAEVLVPLGSDPLSYGTSATSPASSGSGGSGGSSSSKPSSLFGHKPFAEVDRSTLEYVNTGGHGYANYLKPEAARAVQDMIRAAAREGITLGVADAHRTVEEQATLFNKKVRERGSESAAAYDTAPPGHSEHHTGYAVDIADNNGLVRGGSSMSWLQANAGRFGFEQSFTGQNGIMAEPWHLRYVGSATAQNVFGANNPTGAASETQKRIEAFEISLVDLGRAFESAGLRVREHSQFGDGSIGRHSPNSYHYFDEALDITDWRNPADEAGAIAWTRQARNALRPFVGSGLSEVLGPGDPGHDTHLHIAARDQRVVVTPQMMRALSGIGVSLPQSALRPTTVDGSFADQYDFASNAARAEEERRQRQRQILEDTRRRQDERTQQANQQQLQQMQLERDRALKEFDLETARLPQDQRGGRSELRRLTDLDYAKNIESTEIEQALATLKIERDRKVADQASGERTTGRDISSEIKFLEKRKELLEANFNLEAQTVRAEFESQRAENIKAANEQLQETQYTLEDIKLQYADDTPETRYAQALKPVLDRFLAIKTAQDERIEATEADIKASEMLGLNTDELNSLLQQQLRVKQQILDVEGETVGKVTERIQLEEEALRLERKALESGFTAGILDATADITSDPFDAGKLREQAAIIREQTRYEQELFELRRRYSKEPSVFEKLADDAKKLHDLNLQGIEDQFKSLGETIGENVGGALEGLGRDLITLRNPLDAFRNLLGRLVDSFLDLAFSQLNLGGIFGGLFGSGRDGAAVPSFKNGGETPYTPILGFFHGGEQILSDTTGEAGRYRQLQSQYGPNPLSSILTAPQLSQPSMMRADYNTSGLGSVGMSVNVNNNLTFNGGESLSQQELSRFTQTLEERMALTASAVFQEQFRSRGRLR